MGDSARLVIADDHPLFRGALREAVSGLFEKVERIERQVSKGRADAADALGLLKACTVRRSYDKVEGAVAICKQLEPARAAENSRSFRKLLKVLGCAQEAPTPRKAARRPQR